MQRIPSNASYMLSAATRRLLYRATLGRLRSPENIIKGSEGKVEGLKGKMDDYTQEAKKLHVSGLRTAAKGLPCERALWRGPAYMC